MNSKLTIKIALSAIILCIIALFLSSNPNAEYTIELPEITITAQRMVDTVGYILPKP